MGEFELLKNENKRNEVEEKKQILSEYPTWKFVFFYVTPKRFSSIKVGLCIFFNLDSFKTKENDLKIHLYGLIIHSSEKRRLRSTFLSDETLQNLPYL